MKYSLRSLMTFSIRDIALTTVIVAVLVAWWVDRSRLVGECNQLRRILGSNSLSENDPSAIYYVGDDTALFPPTSSASAPNPPKP
jgi:hypothetical protein